MAQSSDFHVEHVLYNLNCFNLLSLAADLT